MTVDLERLIEQTSENVRSALEAAQRRADEIVRDAEAEAQRIRAEAEAEARLRLDRVRNALEQLEAGLGERQQRQPEPAATPSPAPTPATAEPQPEASDPETAAAPAESDGGDAGAARLVAMKLALDGTPREEARRQLEADYDVDDLDSLLDRVYAKAGK